MACIYKQPNARKIQERYLRRVTDYDFPDREEYIMNCLRAWDRMVLSTYQLLDKMKELGEEDAIRIK